LKSNGFSILICRTRINRNVPCVFNTFFFNTELSLRPNVYYYIGSLKSGDSMEGGIGKHMKIHTSKAKKLLSFFMMFIMILAVTALSVSAQEDVEQTDEDAFAAILGLIIVCMVIALVIAIAIAVWIYKDAEKRGKNGILWVVFLIIGGVLLNFIGVIAVIIIWLLVRPPEMPPGMPYPPPGAYYPPPPQPYYPPPQQPGYPPQQPPYY
jgi:hypothetical protein